MTTAVDSSAFRVVPTWSRQGANVEGVSEVVSELVELRRRAIARDRIATVTLGLGLLSRELFMGLCRVTDAFFTHERAFVLTTPTQNPRPLTAQRCAVLQAVLSGSDQVGLAIDMGLSPSTIAAQAKIALSEIGVQNGRVSRPHPLLLLAATEYSSSGGSLSGRLSFTDDQGLSRVISIPRVEGDLANLLTPSEQAIARSIVEGDSHAEIARIRCTSTRTVANQVAAIFRRLGVSGRNELLLRLFAERRERFSGAADVLVRDSSPEECPIDL